MGICRVAHSNAGWNAKRGGKEWGIYEQPRYYGDLF
jgi:hypothetical protein